MYRHTVEGVVFVRTITPYTEPSRVIWMAVGRHAFDENHTLHRTVCGSSHCMGFPSSRYWETVIVRYVINMF